MSRHLGDRPETRHLGGICTRCAHDLEAREDGHVYCSNEACSHNFAAVVTGNSIFAGPRA